MSLLTCPKQHNTDTDWKLGKNGFIFGYLSYIKNWKATALWPPFRDKTSSAENNRIT